MRTMTTRGLGGKVRVRIKRRWRGYDPGAIISPTAALRKVLIQQQVAEEVLPEVPAVETAVHVSASAEPPFGDSSAKAPDKADRPRRKKSQDDA